MTPSFTQWLAANFLETDTKTLPSADDRPPRCNGKAACMERILGVVGGDISPEQEEVFKANIQHCLPCYQEFDVQLAIRQAVQLKVEEKPVPEGLLDSIRRKIALPA